MSAAEEFTEKLQLLFLVLGWILSKNLRPKVREFPPDLSFGTATGAYQVEGAWNEDGKSISIWDYMTHTNPCAVRDCSNGDVATDSYHQYKRDVEMMRELGLDHFRFSLSWPRILPTGFPDKINKAGVQYYKNLIDEMLKYNIKPMVTIYHWDIPQKLQEMGGWTNPYVIDWYNDYARVVFELFGDKVKNWITINEPREVCLQGYGEATLAPLVNISGIANYMCSKNLLLSHAKAYRMYNKEFRPTQQGTVGITLSVQWHEPETDKDAEATEDMLQFEFGQYAHPIFSETGDWPPVMKRRVEAKSAAQGFKRSRLPEFTPEEVKLIKGSSDFFGLNSYTTYLVYRNESVEGFYDVPSYLDDIGAIRYQPSNWTSSGSSWLKVVPWGFYKLLTKIRKDYGNPPVYITENGLSSHGGLVDDDRVSYLRNYLDAMLDAIEEGSDIKTYTVWSHMDNFEWMGGYVEKFGLYQVDYGSPKRIRTPRKSAFAYKEIVRTRKLDYSYKPDTTEMTIDEGH